MTSMSVVGLVVAGVILALLVATVVARHGQRAGGGTAAAPASLAGAVVLLLALLNVYQFAMGSAAGLPENVRRPTRVPRPATHRAPATGPASPFLSDPAEQAVVDRFAKLFYETDGTWQNRQWLGVRALQNPNDAWVHQELIVELQPDYVIEAGTAAGGGALFWAMVLREANPRGKVITIDIEDLSRAAREHPLWKERVEFVLGSSTDPAVVSAIAKRVRGSNVLVILDSDHRQSHVVAELKAYAPLVPVGGYVIVQDSNINGHPVYPGHGPGPMEAIDAFLAGDDRFESDRSRESLLHTMHPKGYLKRVK